MIWVFRYLRINVRFRLNSKLQWLKSLHNRLPILRFARCHNKLQRTLRFTGKTPIRTFLCFLFPFSYAFFLFSFSLFFRLPQAHKLSTLSILLQKLLFFIHTSIFLSFLPSPPVPSSFLHGMSFFLIFFNFIYLLLFSDYYISRA